MKFPQWRGRRSEELDEEVEAHLEAAIRERMERGESREQAEAAARRDFGNVGLVKDVTREMWGWAWIDRLAQDTRYGMRQLRRNPGFTAVAVVTLVLGIGANTAVFSIVNAVLLQPMPYRDGDRLVVATRRASGVLRTLASYPDFTDFKESGAFERAAAIRGRGFFLGREEGPSLVSGGMVSPGFFDVLGVVPALGRTFLREEERAIENVVVIGHELWDRHFGRDPKVIGRSLELSGTGYLVVGVLGSDYRDPLRPVAGRDVYVPMAVPEREITDRNSQWLQIIARLRPDQTLEQTRSIIERLSEEAYRTVVDPRALAGFTVVPLREHQVGDAKPLLWLILGAVVFVLLIGCANVANLLLARITSRRDELALRSAIGATRGRLAVQLITESLLLSALGGAGALIFMLWGLDLIKALSPTEIPWLDRSRMDLSVFGFTFLVSMVTGLLFAALPAVRGTRLDLITGLKESKGGSAPRRRALNLLLVGEVALTITLLVGAMLALISLVRLSSVDPGFEAKEILTANLIYAGDWARPRQSAFARDLLARLRALPDVRAAGVVDNLPLSGSFSQFSTRAAGFLEEVRPELSGQSIEYEQGVVSGEYFRAMGIPLLAGRSFTSSDGAETGPVVIVSADLGRILWGELDPLGRRVNFYDSESKKQVPATVVGVVGGIRQRGLDVQPNPTLYRPLSQAEAMGQLVVVVKGENPERFASAVRQHARELDRAVIVGNVQTFEQILRQHTATPRFLAVLLGSFAGFAVLLAAIGIYGVLSYGVSQRMQEIGIRMALGARPAGVLWLTLAGGMKYAAIGVAIGLVAAFWLSRLMKTMLFDVSTTYPAVYVGMALFVAIIALLACVIPARRAARVDPIVALRCQ